MCAANKELQRLSSQLSEVKARVDAIAIAIDEFQEYSEYSLQVKPYGLNFICLIIRNLYVMSF